jgi:enoyl-CoA hydratase/carnithine racemase
MKTITERMIARKDGAIGWMLFNNPARHNAVSIDMWRAIPQILSEFEPDRAIRVVVFGSRRPQRVCFRRRYLGVRAEALVA